jgi:hypothetical protein
MCSRLLSPSRRPIKSRSQHVPSSVSVVLPPDCDKEVSRGGGRASSPEARPSCRSRSGTRLPRGGRDATRRFRRTRPGCAAVPRGSRTTGSGNRSRHLQRWAERNDVGSPALQHRYRFLDDGAMERRAGSRLELVRADFDDSGHRYLLSLHRIDRLCSRPNGCRPARWCRPLADARRELSAPERAETCGGGDARGSHRATLFASSARSPAADVQGSEGIGSRYFSRRDEDRQCLTQAATAGVEIRARDTLAAAARRGSSSRWEACWQVQSFCWRRQSRGRGDESGGWRRFRGSPASAALAFAASVGVGAAALARRA